MRRNLLVTIISFILAINFGGCASGGLTVLVNDDMTIPQEYSYISPPAYDDLDVGEITLPRSDWVMGKEVELVNEEQLSEYLEWATYTIASQGVETKLSAWGIHPVLSSLNTAYLLTKDITYLKRFKDIYQYWMSIRMDAVGMINYNGEIKPQWKRLDRFNIFSVSPYQNYSIDDIDEISDERGWHSLAYSDINYSGLILEQMLRFAQIVKKYSLNEYVAMADEIIDESIKVIISHEDEWVEIAPTEGYYIFPRRSPFFLDGVEMPINEAAIFGSALVRLYMLTGDNAWIERALAMWYRWKKHMYWDGNGYITYPYVVGAWYDGWNENDEISINSPNADAKREHETFHKAAMTVKYLILLEKAVPGLVKLYLDEFYKVMVAVQSIGGTPISRYSGMFGFAWPNNTYHVWPPFYFEGWIALVHKNDIFTREAIKYWCADGRNELLTNIMYLQLMTGEDIEECEGIEMHIQPDYSVEEDGMCHISLAESAVVKLSFYHLTPKHNTLYLYVNNEEEQVIRLDSGGGYFEGMMYAPKDQCIKLRWNTEDRYSYPGNDDENVVRALIFN